MDVSVIIKQEKGRKVEQDNTEHLERISSNLLLSDRGYSSVLGRCVCVWISHSQSLVMVCMEVDKARRSSLLEQDDTHDNNTGCVCVCGFDNYDSVTFTKAEVNTDKNSTTQRRILIPTC